ncbi:hypothetical protein C772_01997 [Bhargavaea cecembensis DSE10]|uniref:Uncharacterized protein n=1 Tax=Bhargavaea cecembensis DSE10 TaxID=1235279 RepID=M7NFI4_9BACL|nr:hypothetical protein [Bhargavaea cecembensis]EMR06017.1 hypothetical protein C772_01997 [Bhargavaea cecembensis DSE10]
MELDKVKLKSFQVLGWFSVIAGIVALALLNIAMLSGYDLPITSQLSFWITVILISGLISLSNRQSRSLGFWGLGIAVYLAFFIAVIFILGWIIVPFP